MNVIRNSLKLRNSDFLGLRNTNCITHIISSSTSIRKYSCSNVTVESTKFLKQEISSEKGAGIRCVFGSRYYSTLNTYSNDETQTQDDLRLKLMQEYVNWRFILAKMNYNDEVQVFRKLMETYGIHNDEDLATEMSFLDVKTSVFIGHSAANMDKITLEVLLQGLRMYGWSYPDTKKAVLCFI